MWLLTIIYIILPLLIRIQGACQSAITNAERVVECLDHRTREYNTAKNDVEIISGVYITLFCHTEVGSVVNVCDIHVNAIALIDMLFVSFTRRVLY